MKTYSKYEKKNSIMKFSKGLTPKCTSMNNGDTLGVVGSITTST